MAVIDAEKLKLTGLEPEAKPTDPDYPGVAYRRQAQPLQLVRDVYDGTKSMRDAGERYLPKFPLEDTESYKARKSTAVLYNALKRTVKGLVGMVFRKDPVVPDELPDVIQDHLENIDLQGRSVAVFAQKVFDAALLDGHTHILVDRQRMTDQVTSIAAEREAGMRAYWNHVLKADLLSFRYEMRGGKPVLTQVAIREYASVYTGPYGEEVRKRVRVLRLVEDGSGAEGEPPGTHVAFQVHELQKPGGQGGEPRWVQIDAGFMTIDEIPLVTVYAGWTGFLESEPPLLDLAYENIGHFQIRSDRRNALHIAGVPIPVFTGVSPDVKQIAVGPDHAIHLTDPQSKAMYLEPAGTALDEQRQELRDIEGRMAILGLSMLVSETRGEPETATSRRLDKSESDSQLASAAVNLENAIREAVRLHAKWESIEVPDDVRITINRDFEDQRLDAQMVSAMSTLVRETQLSLETLWEVLVAGEILPDSFDPELEKERLDDMSKLDSMIAAIRSRGLLQPPVNQDGQPPVNQPAPATNGNPGGGDGTGQGTGE